MLTRVTPWFVLNGTLSGTLSEDMEPRWDCVRINPDTRGTSPRLRELLHRPPQSQASDLRFDRVIESHPSYFRSSRRSLPFTVDEDNWCLFSAQGLHRRHERTTD